MSTRDPEMVTDEDWVLVCDGKSCSAEVLEGAAWFRIAAEKPAKSPPPLADGRRWLGHSASALGRPDFNYSVPAPSRVYVRARTDTAIIVVTEF